MAEQIAFKKTTLELYFKRWRQKQTHTTFLVIAPKEKAEAIKAAILETGGKIEL